MTRNNNILIQFNSGYDPDAGDYRHPPRPPMHDRGSFNMSSRANPRTDPMARSQGQIRNGAISHPTTVQSNGNGSAAPRRRIPVACGRCRKRKIRCSGDPGDNTGCGHCRGAQAAHECKFERVSSSTIDLRTYSGATSPPSNGTGQAHSGGSGHGPGSGSTSLGLHAAGSYSAPCLHSSGYPSSMGMGHSMGFSSSRGTLMSSKLYHQDGLIADPTTSSMNLVASRFYEGLGNEISAPTDSNYSQYMLNSETGHSLSTDNANAVLSSQHSDYPRHWSSVQPTNKSSSSTYYSNLEPETTASSVTMGSIMSGFMPCPAGPRNASSTSLDSYPTMFPALGSLSSSLPESGSRSTLLDKVLPPLGPARMPTTDFGGIKLYSSYTDSSGPSSASHSRSSTSTRRSPAASYIPASPSLQQVVPSSSERSTPTLLSTSERSTPTLLSSSASSNSMSNYVTSSVSNMNTIGLYPSNQQSLHSSSIEHLSGAAASMLKQERQKQQQQRTEVDLVPRVSAITAPPLHTSSGTPSSSSSPSNYQQSGEQQHIRYRGLNRIY